MCVIEHFHSEFITHPLVYLDLSAGTPQPGRTGSGLKRALSRGSEEEKAVGLQTWTDEGHSEPNLHFSLFLPDPVR